MWRHITLLAALLFAGPALAGGATTTSVPNTGTTAVSGFTCFSTSFCTAHVLIDNTGTEKGTSANPLTINGTGAGTAVPVTGTFYQATQPVSGTVAISGSVTTTAGAVGQGTTTSGQNGQLMQAATVSSNPSYSAGQTNPLTTTTYGALNIAAPAAQLMTSGSTAPGVDPGMGLAALCQYGSPTVTAGQTVALQCSSNGTLLTTAGGVAQGAAISGLSGPMLQGEYLASAPTYTTATVNPLLTDVSGNLKVNVAAGSAANAAASATGSAVPAQADYQGVNVGANLVGRTGTTVSSVTAGDSNLALVNGVAVAVGHGVATTAQRVELPTDGTGQVAISQGTPGTTNGVSPVLTTAGGWTYKALPGLTTTPTAIKTSAGQLGLLYCFNSNTSVTFVQVFDAATGSVVLGSNDLPFGIPPNSNGGFPLSFPGLQFATAISVAAATTAAGSVAPAIPLDCTAAYN